MLVLLRREDRWLDSCRRGRNRLAASPSLVLLPCVRHPENRFAASPPRPCRADPPTGKKSSYRNRVVRVNPDWRARPGNIRLDPEFLPLPIASSRIITHI